MTIDKSKVKWDEEPIDPKAVKWDTENKKPSTLPANAGLADLAASVVGLPVDSIEKGINLTRAAQGAVAGAVGAHDWMPPLLSGSVGGSKWIKDKLRGTGQPGLSPDNPDPKSRLGTAQYDFVSRGGIIPGAALPAAGSMAAEKLLGQEWGGVGALAPQAAITGYNVARTPSLQRQERLNTVRDATIREGHEAGYVVPPSAARGGYFSKVLESIAGKAAIGQQAALKNQVVTNELARRHAGLPKDTAISVDALERRRNLLSEPYRKVAALDEEAAAALEKLQVKRNESTMYFREFDSTQRVAARKKAESLRSEADQLEKYLEDVARQYGKPDLIQELREARRDIAKTHDVERALNIGDGSISAPILGKMLDKGRPMTGPLEVAARFQQAFPHYMREGEKIPTPGVSAVNPLASVGLGLGGYGALGLPGAAAAALPLLRAPTRAGLLSSPVQNALLPDYSPVRTAPAPQLLYQLGILE